MGITAQIHFFGPINPSTAESFRNMLLNTIQNADVSELEILMSSQGGDLNSGFTMYSYLRSLQVKTTIINMGTVESIAIIPFLAGDKRRAVPHAKFLIHSLSWTFPNAPIDFLRVAENEASLREDAKRYAAIYREHTAGASTPVDVENALSGSAVIIDASQAFCAGITTTKENLWPKIAAGTAGRWDRVMG